MSSSRHEITIAICFWESSVNIVPVILGMHRAVSQNESTRLQVVFV